MEYTQANKKREVAKKMGLTMIGKDSGYGGGMKYKGNGKDSGEGGGMKTKLHGKGTTSGGGMKYKTSNPKANFSNNYTQNGEK
jgi:hypothetical protein